jgi:hypothetical protein
MKKIFAKNFPALRSKPSHTVRLYGRLASSMHPGELKCMEIVQESWSLVYAKLADVIAVAGMSWYAY